MRDQLQQTLSPGFVIERELAGGGMSHVFLAREAALDRRVVVKVLPAAMAGASLERFRREIQLVAALQHPHIVPVHATGESGGLLFYTMPYIEGESLRARLGAGTPLPVAETVRILRDVASALAYAHERGVVHRDVKPDNVLMSGDHAVVTDFGVAKAVAAAAGGRLGPGRAESARDPFGTETITHVGVAVGTPAYMAPEQAAGDPHTDHRADLYALGLLAYELLTGKSPFAHRSSPHELITAQLVELPKPLLEVRPELPPALASLVMQCLEKQPERRPPSAAAVRTALDAVATPSGGGIAARERPRPWRRVAAIAAGAVAVIAGVWVATAQGRGEAALDADLVTVVPFTATAPELSYLSEGMVDLFAARLTGDAGTARVTDPRAVLRALRRGEGDAGAAVPRERALALAERLGAGQLLVGDVTGTSARLTLRATLLDVRDGRPLAQGTVAGPTDSLPQLVDQLAVQLLAIRAGEGARLSAFTSRSYPAIRAYLAGSALYRRGRYEAAGGEFTKALAQDSTFALAGLGLVHASAWYGDPQAAQQGSRLAWAYRDRLSARDRALLEATLGATYPHPPNSAQLIAARARYRDLAPERAEAWSEYGDALFHFGATVGNERAHQQAAEAFRKAVAIDSGHAPALEHLVLLAARANDTAAARRWARLYLAADSLGDGADAVRWRVAIAAGDTATLARLAAKGTAIAAPSQSGMTWVGFQDGVEVERSHALLRAIGEEEVREGQADALIMMADVALVRGRPQEADALLDRFEALKTPVPVEKLKAALVSDGSAAAADAAAAELRATFDAAAAQPSAPQAKGVGVQCLLPLWALARHDDTALVRRGSERLRAIAAREAPASPLREYAIGCALLQEAAAATIARAPDARALVARADSVMRTGPASGLLDFGNVLVARLWERHGAPAMALAAVRRRPYWYRRTPYLGAALREEGRLAAATGDLDGAVGAWRHFVALRENAEPSLRREVEGVKAELARVERRRAEGR